MPQVFTFGDYPLTFSEMLIGGNKEGAVLPVFFIHSRDNPFCKALDCPCQWGKLKAQALIELAEWGEVHIRPVADW